MANEVVLYALQTIGGSSVFKQVRLDENGAVVTTGASGTVTVTGTLDSAVAVGPTAADAVDDGNAPVQVGGIARQANPTAVAGNDVVKTTHDDLGRPVTRPIQVRDLIRTARAEVSNVTETTLLAESAGVLHDLIYILGANESGAAVNIDIRDVVGGNIVLTLEIPASSTAGVALPVPIPQSETGNAWTFKNSSADDSTTTVSVTALFSEEV